MCEGQWAYLGAASGGQSLVAFEPRRGVFLRVRRFLVANTRIGLCPKTLAGGSTALARKRRRHKSPTLLATCRKHGYFIAMPSEPPGPAQALEESAPLSGLLYPAFEYATEK